MVAVRRAAWEGTTKTLVVSIDVGTTFTAASFCIIEPGEVPVYHEVCCPIWGYLPPQMTYLICLGPSMAQTSACLPMCSGCSIR